jgi:hypothetical protein
MSEIIEEESPMIRSIRPSEAVKAYEGIEKSELRVVAEKTKAWGNWTRTIGPFVQERTEKAKREAKGTRGPTYSAVVKKEMGQFYPTYQKLSENGTISYLLKIMGELEAINLWRNRIPEDERPTSPRRIWEGYQASIQSTIKIIDQPQAEAEEVEEVEEVDEEKKAKRAKRRANNDAENARYVEELEEKANRSRMTADPEMNAERIWLGLKDAVGYETAVPLARATIEKLAALLARVEDPDNWAPKGKSKSK